MQRRDFVKLSSASIFSLSTIRLDSVFSVTKQKKWQGKKVVFLGDSITQAGEYINFLESTLMAISGQISSEFLNLGLASETISGLSEEAHPFPRPYLHDRLHQILSQTQPDIIFACYGINCGIYHPFSEAIFQKYKQGIEQLIKAAEKQKAELILVTPPPYASPIVDWETARKDAGREDYSYARPYLAYDDVMEAYGEWILSFEGSLKVIDVQVPLRRFQSLCYDEDFIHPNRFGHQLMAISMLNSLEWQEKRPILEITAEPTGASGAENFGQIYLASMPLLPYRAYSEDKAYNLQFAGTSMKLILKDCPTGTFQLFDRNHMIGQYAGEALRNGILLNHENLKDSLQELSPWNLSENIYDLIVKKRSIYDYSLLQHIGHKRPMNRAGVPLHLAKMKKREIEAQITDMLQVPSWKLNLVQVN